MKTPAKIQPAADIKHRILTVRGEKVLLDADLARIYSVQTRVLNQAVRRNLGKFPDDFRFQLIQAKADQVLRLRSQFVTLKLGRGQHRKYLPYAFTEPGAIMAANVLNSPRAVRMSVFVMRAFVKMRELLGGTKDLARQLKTLEARLTARLDGRSWTCSSASCGSSTRRPNRRRPAARSASTSSPTTRPAALRKAGNDESRRLCRCADSIRNPHSPIRTSARRRLRIQGGGAGNPGMLVDMSASWTIRKSAGKTNADTLWN